MRANEWVKLIRNEFGVSRSTANAMYHLMIEYYRVHKPIDWSENLWQE